ncbi:hypothetical protein TNCT_212351 [Trichonephila clavata]|uniref:Uncharacterized protein n=1 Tax=Trichonephila clavata TaxID=2740835 RepID=A0A8X6J714_TRICU|nr:hypothetical protein TNCT_212351 [Trichonephila clavata]
MKSCIRINKLWRNRSRTRGNYRSSPGTHKSATSPLFPYTPAHSNIGRRMWMRIPMKWKSMHPSCDNYVLEAEKSQKQKHLAWRKMQEKCWLF